MRKLLPQKSLFGFSILGSWQSTFSAYSLLALLFVLHPFFGNESIELKAGYLFLLLLNLSTIILTFNSTQQNNKKPFFFWLLLNLPLWCLIPMEISFLFYGIKGLIN